MTNSHPDQIDTILTKAFNDFYDYITEKDIIKAAHEYSTKSVYAQAHAAVKVLMLEARISTYTKVQTSLNAYINGTSTFPAADELLEIRDRIKNLEGEIEKLK